MSEPDFKSRLSYDPETGRFTALVQAGRRRVGDELGYITQEGYRMLAVHGRWYLAHRLAWFLSTGAWPTHEIDHINGVRADNRIVNLRPCTRSQNMMNTRKRGAYFHKKSKKWVANIRVRGERFHLGMFATEDDALVAYEAAVMRLHGEFGNIAPRSPDPVQQPLFGGEAA